jgi:hypothetical protein
VIGGSEVNKLIQLQDAQNVEDKNFVIFDKVAGECLSVDKLPLPV